MDLELTVAFYYLLFGMIRSKCSSDASLTLQKLAALIYFHGLFAIVIINTVCGSRSDFYIVIMVQFYITDEMKYKINYKFLILQWKFSEKL